MARPKEEHPTVGELEVLKVLWEQGPSTVREVMDVLNHRRLRAYTSVMSLLNVMTEKCLLTRRPQGRAFVYQTRVTRERTLGRLVTDLVGRAFEGSASALVSRLLDESNPSEQELEKIRQAIEAFQEQRGV